jgi:hypothetical protein
MTDDGGRLIGGRYRLAERIGSGGMGTVWRAVDELVGREVAVKQPRLPGDPHDAAQQRAYARLRREARAAAQVDHPAAVAIHDVVMEDGLPWIVMELIRGESLHEVLKRGALPPAESARIGLGVVGALAAAHTAGVVHRDVKPANVLIGSHNRVVLTDFGIAHIQGEESLTVSGEFVGSLEFIAPERMSGNGAGPESDLWSLGVLLYAAVEGWSPFRRTTVESTLAAVLSAEVPPPVRAGELGRVIERLLSREPARRPAASEVAEALEAVTKGRPLPGGFYAEDEGDAGSAGVAQDPSGLRELSDDAGTVRLTAGLASGAEAGLVPGAASGLVPGLGLGLASASASAPEPAVRPVEAPAEAAARGERAQDPARAHTQDPVRKPTEDPTEDPAGDDPAEDKNRTAPVQPAARPSRAAGRLIAAAVAGAVLVGGGVWLGTSLGDGGGSGAEGGAKPSAEAPPGSSEPSRSSKPPANADAGTDPAAIPRDWTVHKERKYDAEVAAPSAYTEITRDPANPLVEYSEPDGNVFLRLTKPPTVTTPALAWANAEAKEFEGFGYEQVHTETTRTNFHGQDAALIDVTYTEAAEDDVSDPIVTRELHLLIVTDAGEYYDLMVRMPKGVRKYEKEGTDLFKAARKRLKAGKAMTG